MLIIKRKTEVFRFLIFFFTIFIFHGYAKAQIETINTKDTTRYSEAEAFAEKQREAELAAMSEEERSIVEITQRLNSGEGKGQGSGCQLATELAQLCEQASCWSDDLQLQLHAVAVQTCKHLDIDTKKNKKWKERLRNLKVGD